MAAVLGTRGWSADRLGDQLRLAGLWFSGSALWEALPAFVLPILVQRDVGVARSAVALSLLTTVGTLLASAVHPLAGWASDRTRTAFGRRRPYLAVGGLASAAAVLWMAFSTGFPALLSAVLLLQVAYNTALAAYQAYIPELAPAAGRGKASGFLGLMSSLGALAGAVGSLLLVHGAGYRVLLFGLAALLLGGVALTIFGLPEMPPPVRPAAAPAGPRRGYRDFLWVVATRGLVLLCFYSLLTYLAYYLERVEHLGSSAPSEAVGVTILFAAVAAAFAGQRSDAVGRRVLVSCAGGLMGLAAIAFLLVHGLVPILAVGALFGAGYGTYIAVDWALVTDVLPDPQGVARDMGFWGLGTTVPQVIAPLVGGSVFLLLPHGAAAYRVIFAATCLYALAGSALVWKVKAVR